MKNVLVFILCLMLPLSAYAAVGGRKGHIVDVTLTNAGQEFSVPVSPDTTAFEAQSRTAADFKMAFNPNESGSNFFTVKSGTVFSATGLNLQPNSYTDISPYTKVYFQSATNGQVVEVLYFT